MPFKYEINGQIIEFDKEPTEADIDEVASSIKSSSFSNEEPSSFTTAQFSDLPSERTKSPLNPWQEIVYSGAGNDKDLQFKALQKFLPENDITVSEDGDFMVDGNRLNPAGFDFGDITRNLLDIFPLIGQVGGSLAGAIGGAAAGATAGGVGAVPGAIAGNIIGGTAGATTGRVVQLGLGDLFGLDVDGKDYLEAISNEAGIALTGELLGAGIAGVAGKVGKPIMGKLGGTKLAKGASNMWTNILKKLKKNSPAVLEYMSGVDQRALQRVMDTGAVKHGQSISKVLAPEFFDDGYGGELASKLIFGKSNVVDDLFIGDKKVSLALRELVGNIRENKKNPATQELIKNLFGGEIDNDVISTILTKSDNQLFSGKFLDADAPLNLAKKFTNIIENETNLVGNMVKKAKTAAIKKTGLSTPVQIDDVIGELNTIIKNEVRPLVPFGQKGKLGPLSQIQDIINRSTRTTATGKALVKETSLGNALKLDKLLDDSYEVMLKSNKIPSSVANRFSEVKKVFNKRIDDMLGLTEYNQSFSMFKEILEGSKLDKTLALEGLENRFSNMGKQSQFFKNAVDDVLTAAKSKVGGKSAGLGLIDDIKTYNNVKRLMDMDSSGKLSATLSKFTDIINNGNFVSGTGDRLIERTLKSLGKAMKKETGFDFFEEGILNRQTALKFSGTKLNVLRVGSILTLALGGLGGFSQFGALGAVGGLTAAAQLTPRNIAKGLVSFDKLAKQKLLEKAGAKTSKMLANDQTLAVSRALLGKLVAANNNK